MRIVISRNNFLSFYYNLVHCGHARIWRNTLLHWSKKLFSPCHKRPIDIKLYNENNYSNRSKIEETRKQSIQHEPLSSVATQKPTEYSMLCILLVLHRFPQHEVYATADFHAIFKTKPMYLLLCFALDVSRILKESLFRQFSDPNRTSTTLRFQSEQLRAF